MLKSSFSIAVLCVCLSAFLDDSYGQAVRPLRPFTASGKIKQVVRNGVLVEDASGRAWQLRLPAENGVVMLSNKQKFQAQKPVVEISGSLKPESLTEDAPVRVECYVDDRGRVREPVSEIKWLDKAGFKAGTKLNRKNKNERGELLCLVLGTVERVDPEGFMVKVPKSRVASNGTMAIPLSKEAKVIVKTRDLIRSSEGDRVSRVTGVELSSGDFVITKLEIQLMDDKSTGSPDGKPDKNRRKPPAAVADNLDSRYQSLSDEPVEPRAISGKLIKMRSDVSDRDAKVLQDETRLLVDWLTAKFRKPVKAPFECYVVGDITRWPDDQFSDEIKGKLTSKLGVTVPQSSNGSAIKPRKATIYSPNNKRMLREQVVHAYLYQAYGSLGPDWLSEGLATLGRQLKQPVNEVSLESSLLAVLRKGRNRQSLKQVIGEEASTENAEAEKPSRRMSEKVLKMKAERRAAEKLAYKWAFCYVLTNNRNYSRKFPEFASGLLTERPGASFSKSYGSVSKQLTFEYDQFTENVSNGYRTDLCAWNWSHRFKKLDKSSTEKIAVQAEMGWQPTVSVEKGQSYEVAAKGTWRVDGAGTKTDADGVDNKGKLIAVIMDDYKLSEVIPIGKAGKFRAVTDGQLYMRCDEKWSALSDNAGKLTVFIRQAKKK